MLKFFHALIQRTLPLTLGLKPALPRLTFLQTVPMCLQIYESVFQNFQVQKLMDIFHMFDIFKPWRTMPGIYLHTIICSFVIWTCKASKLAVAWKMKTWLSRDPFFEPPPLSNLTSFRHGILPFQLKSPKKKTHEIWYPDWCWQRNWSRNRLRCLTSVFLNF